MKAIKKITEKEYQQALNTVRLYKEQLQKEYVEVIKSHPIDKNTVLGDIPAVEKDARLCNILRSNGLDERITTIAAFEELSVREIEGFRGAGKIIAQRIMELCRQAGVELQK